MIHGLKRMPGTLLVPAQAIDMGRKIGKALTRVREEVLIGDRDFVTILTDCHRMVLDFLHLHSVVGYNTVVDSSTNTSEFARTPVRVSPY